jgi:hypothetical protein
VDRLVAFLRGSGYDDDDDIDKMRAGRSGERFTIVDKYVEAESPKHKKRNKRMTGVNEDFLES